MQWSILTFDIGLHEVCVRVGVRYVITKFSGMDSLPNFLTHGAPLRARELRYEYGTLSHARFARVGAPLWNLFYRKSQNIFTRTYNKRIRSWFVYYRSRKLLVRICILLSRSVKISCLRTELAAVVIEDFIHFLQAVHSGLRSVFWSYHDQEILR